MPISELPQEEMYWHTILPPNIDLDRLQINVGRIQTLQRLGGLASIDVVGYEGETTKYGFGVDSTQADGSSSATASMAVEKAETHQVELDLSRDPRHYRYQKNDARIKVNVTELYERVRAADQLADYQLDWHQLYAQELNAVLSRGIIRAAREHLINNVDSKSRGDFWFSTVLAGILAAMDGGSMDDLAYNALLLHSLVGNTVALASGWVDKKQYAPLFSEGDAMRFSLIDGYQVDRVAAAAGLAKASRLVRAAA